MFSYHAHVYFDAGRPDQLQAARQLRKQLADRFQLPVGTLHLQPVGPHPEAMFQALFGHDDFSRVVPWLMKNRNDLTVLIHADTGNDLLDHTRHVMWLGNSLPLRLDRL